MCFIANHSTRVRYRGKPGAREGASQLRAHGLELRAEQLHVADHNRVASLRERELFQAKRLAQSAFDAVSLHRAARAPAGRKSDLEFVARLVAEMCEIEIAARHEYSLFKNALDLRFAAQDSALGQKAPRLISR